MPNIDSHDPRIAEQPSVRTPKTFTLEGTDLKFTALGDRVIIKEDDFRTGYECTACNGSTKVVCSECGGVGERGEEVKKKCSHCDGAGSITCTSCNGKGALIIAADVAKRRPASGVIVSAGQKCQYLSEGESVLYSNFAGYVIDLPGNSLRVLHESEILAGMEGHLTLTNYKGHSDIAQFGN